jgi:hypothetical protein
MSLNVRESGSRMILKVNDQEYDALYLIKIDPEVMWYGHPAIVTPSIISAKL